MTPWSALLTAALFVAGLVLFIVGAAKIGDYTMQASTATFCRLTSCVEPR
jgi:hypothetical protein